MFFHNIIINEWHSLFIVQNPSSSPDGRAISSFLRIYTENNLRLCVWPWYQTKTLFGFNKTFLNIHRRKTSFKVFNGKNSVKKFLQWRHFQILEWYYCLEWLIIFEKQSHQTKTGEELQNYVVIYSYFYKSLLPNCQPIEELYCIPLDKVA